MPQSLLSEFRRECGQTCPFLIRISSSESGTRAQTVLWDRPSLIIGRGQECGLRLPHAEVSRQHTVLQVINGKLWCSDLGSSRGTHWAHGARSRQNGMLGFGEPVSIGPYSLTIEPAPQYGAYDTDSEDKGDQQAVPDGLFLDFSDGTHEPQRWAATRDVTIVGSGDCAKVSLVHPSVSKCHCAIVRTRKALWIVDLLAEEGTIVNDSLVSVARLESGDLIHIGRFEVAAHYGSPLDDDAINFTPTETEEPPRALSHEPTQEQDLAHLQAKALEAAHQNGAASGISEQFVLDVINQMGVMQQQALQHAQQSMNQALQAVTATYQGRIEALEDEYATLKSQLRGLPGPAGPNDDPYPPGLPDYNGAYSPLMPMPPNMVEPEFEDLPEPEHGSYECDDPEIREQWLREKMKSVEDELDKTRKGWGKRLIDLMGY